MTGPSDSGVPLPCPFCGGSPEFENTDERARLRCAGCGTEGGLFFFSEEECESGLSDATEAKAIAAWNRRAALPVAPCDADRELMEREIDALEDLTETIEMGDPHWADAKCFKAAVAAIAALRTRLLRHPEGKE